MHNIAYMSIGITAQLYGTTFWHEIITNRWSGAKLIFLQVAGRAERGPERTERQTFWNFGLTDTLSAVYRAERALLVYFFWFF